MKVIPRDGFDSKRPQIKLEATLDDEGNLVSFILQSNFASVAVDDLVDDEVEHLCNEYQNQVREVESDA